MVRLINQLTLPTSTGSLLVNVQAMTPEEELERLVKASNQIFRPRINYGADTPAYTGSTGCIVTTAKIYSLSGSDAGTQTAVKAFHLYLIVCGTSDSVVGDEWESYLATLACVFFPSIKRVLLRGNDHEEITLSTADVKALTEWYEKCWKSYHQTKPNAQGDHERPPHSHRAPLGLTCQLPQGAGTVHGDMENLMALPSLYGHFSLALFLADKNLKHNVRPWTHECGAAIEQKYFNGKQIASLTGTLAFSDAAHQRIPTAYNCRPILRKVLFKKVAFFDQPTSDECSEVIATTTRLMRYSGMQHVPLIDRYLSRHKHADSIMMLETELEEYRASKRDMDTVPKEQVPYFKLIYGDHTRPFLRKNLTNLVAVAVTDAREENPNLRYRWVPDNYDQVMERYNKEMAALQRAMPQK